MLSVARGDSSPAVGFLLPVGLSVATVGVGEDLDFLSGEHDSSIKGGDRLSEMHQEGIV